MRALGRSPHAARGTATLPAARLRRSAPIEESDPPMNIEGWQAGLFMGAGFVALIELAARAYLFRRRHRGCQGHCLACEGCLDTDGRAVVPIESLAVCGACGDTVPAAHHESDQGSGGVRGRAM